jgi:hypothetical protein
MSILMRGVAGAEARRIPFSGTLLALSTIDQNHAKMRLMKYAKAIEENRTFAPPRNRRITDGSVDISTDKQLKRSPHKATPGGNADHPRHAAPPGHLYATQKSHWPNTPARMLKVASGLALVAAGCLFISWTGHRMDRQMRDEIFLQAKMVAQAVDIDNVTALSGTEADLGSREYRKIKEQLTLIRQVAPKCRFIYLMGLEPDGKIFFFVDSEDPSSADYSPPGQTYDEATKTDYQVFATGSGNASGAPYKDRWGVWITAMVPMLRPNSDKVLAVLGMDFNAETWKWDVANRTALPASPAAFLMLLGIYILVFPARVAWR